MSLLRTSLLEVRTSLLQTKRFRGKINIQRPRAPHFERALYIKLTNPYYLSQIKDKKPSELCCLSKKTREEVDNPYERILANETLDLFKKSKLVGFFHQNPMNALDQFKAYTMFYKEGMSLQTIGKSTLGMALKGTQYEAVMDMYISRNTIVFSKESKLKEMLKITKRFPQLVLLAGIYEGRFMSFEDLTKYNLIPNLQTAQSILLHTLNQSSNKLYRQLNSKQQSLMALLEDRKKQLE